MPVTVNETPASAMTQAERAAFASREGNGDDAEFSTNHWVYVPDMRVDVLRKLAFPRTDDVKLQGQYRNLRAHYESHACDDRYGDDNPIDTMAKMLAWWEERSECYPLVFSRQGDGRLLIWDGCHRLTHYYLTGKRKTVPALVGRPQDGQPGDDGHEYKPVVHLGGLKVSLVLGSGAGGRRSLSLVDGVDREPVPVTLDIPELPLGPDEVFVSDWGFNNGVLGRLEKVGVLRATGRTVRRGSLDVPVALILV